MEYANHPAADAFPMMDEKRYNELLNDMKTQGQLIPITLCDGMVLDGRNRYKACKELNIEPKTKDFGDGDPWAYVWSLNGQRRDLNAEQRYLIWKFCSENSTAFQATKQAIQDAANKARSAAANAQHAVSKPYAGEKKPEMVIQQTVGLPSNDDALNNVIKEAAEALKNETYEDFIARWEKRGIASVCESCGGPVFRNEEHRCWINSNKQKTHTPPTTIAKAAASQTNAGAVQRGDTLMDKRPDLAKKVMSGEVKPAEAYRQMKRDEVSANIEALPQDKFTVFYADPPWKYNDSQAVKGDFGTGTGAANCHYPSMTMTELKALDIQSMSADNAVLWLWATCPLLEDALELCKAWGFKYKAQFVWDKVKHNMGHYNSVRHELLLVCTKGSCTPENVKLYDSVQSIERTEHSRKPEEFRDIINTIYPSGKKIELFRRGEAPKGWSVWGNEAK